MDELPRLVVVSDVVFLSRWEWFPLPLDAGETAEGERPSESIRVVAGDEEVEIVLGSFRSGDERIAFPVAIGDTSLVERARTIRPGLPI